MSLMRFVSWNVNGFRAVSKKADWEWFSRTQADVVGLQGHSRFASCLLVHPNAPHFGTGLRTTHLQNSPPDCFA